jgi:hypothetical protein
VELVVLVAVCTAAATGGELQAQLSVLAFEGEAWDRGQIVHPNAFVNVNALGKDTF